MNKRKHNETLLKQYKEQGECCVYCGIPTPFDSITRDHFNPVSKGNNFINNKVFACNRCNCEKNDLNIYEFNSNTFHSIQKSLKSMISKGWKMNNREYEKFKYLTKRFVTTNKIIENGGTPKILFT